MDERQFADLMGRLRTISGYLETLVLESREHRHAEQQHWSDVVGAIQSLEATVDARD